MHLEDVAPGMTIQRYDGMRCEVMALARLDGWKARVLVVYREESTGVVLAIGGRPEDTRDVNEKCFTGWQRVAGCNVEMFRPVGQKPEKGAINATQEGIEQQDREREHSHAEG